MAAFPEWARYATEETWKGSEPYLVVTVPAPGGAGTILPLRISTWDEEITVDFDYYHTHFERWSPNPGDSKYESALIYVRELLAENIAVASWWQDSHCRACSQFEPGTPPSPPVKVAYTRVRIRSWNGTHNAER
jgi:hypothetical protein